MIMPVKEYVIVMFAWREVKKKRLYTWEQDQSDHLTMVVKFR